MSQAHKVNLPIVAVFKPTHESMIAAEYHFYEALKAFCTSQEKRNQAEVISVFDIKEMQEQIAIIQLAAFSAMNKGVLPVIDAVSNDFQYRSHVFYLNYDGTVEYLHRSESFVSSGINVLDSVIATSFIPTLVTMEA